MSRPTAGRTARSPVNSTGAIPDNAKSMLILGRQDLDGHPFRAEIITGELSIAVKPARAFEPGVQAVVLVDILRAGRPDLIRKVGRKRNRNAVPNLAIPAR